MTPPLSPLDALALVHLRALLENARLTARSTASVSRLTALVLLDAVVERVTHMAAVSLPGVEVKAREEFESLVGKVKVALGTSWRSDSWTDVRKLHRARNAAQHEGISADPASLPGWITATERYARSLVGAVYGVDLDHVLLADVVHDPKIKALISDAEKSLKSGDAAASVENVSKAFSDALSRWRRDHESVHGSRPDPFTNFKEFKDLRQLVEDTRKVSAAQSFATDPGEYAWFHRITSGRVESLTVQDAQRALAFTFWWVVRWEAVQAHLSIDRYGEWVKKQRLVRAPGVTRAKIIDAEVDTTSSARDNHCVLIKLADVPDEENYGVWRAKLNQRFFANEQGGAGRGRCVVTDIGTITLRLSANSNVSSALQEIRDILGAVEQEIIDEHVAAQRIQLETQSKIDQFAQEVKANREILPSWIAEIYLTNERMPVPELHMKFTREVWPVVGAQDIVRSASKITHCYPSYDGSYVLGPQLEVSDLIAAFHEVEPAMREAIEAGARRASEQQAEYDAMKRNLELAVTEIRRVVET